MTAPEPPHGCSSRFGRTTRCAGRSRSHSRPPRAAGGPEDAARERARHARRSSAASPSRARRRGRGRRPGREPVLRPRPDPRRALAAPAHPVAGARGESPAALDALVARLAEALRARGFALEARPFRPHLTLARDARAPRGLAPDIEPIFWPVRELALSSRSRRRRDRATRSCKPGRSRANPA